MLGASLGGGGDLARALLICADDITRRGEDTSRLSGRGGTHSSKIFVARCSEEQNENVNYGPRTTPATTIYNSQDIQSLIDIYGKFRASIHDGRGAKADLEDARDSGIRSIQ